MIPFVLWSLINAVVYKADFATLGVRGVINNIVCCVFENVYWFFPILFSVYLAAVAIVFVIKKYRLQIKLSRKQLLCGKVGKSCQR